jgi:alkanesulfonate monooxygenase SsuD/methylene tetrahydromethanopterin reductase-like flavin-dependent oxidoreductase (luciferase family)
MARGRLILTIGTGDELSKREHDAFGLPYFRGRERRAHLEATVRAVRALLGGDPYPGDDHVPHLRGPLLPAAADGGPRVWIGGTSEAAVGSAVELANGWNGWGLPLETFASRAALVRARVAERPKRAGDGAGSVEATWGGVALVGVDGAELDALVERRTAAGKPPPPGAWVVDADGLVVNLRALAAAGASWAILLPSGPFDRIDLIAEVALPALAA